MKHQKKRIHRPCVLILALTALLVAGCSKEKKVINNSVLGSNSTNHISDEFGDVGSRQLDAEEIASWIEKADISILFIGNSHTSSHRLPRIIKRLIVAGDKEKKVFVYSKINGHLADHWNHGETRKAVSIEKWTYVVLQAQKYSQSGRYHYPHDAAIQFTKLAHQQGSKVIMFPEWRQRGRLDEGKRVHKLHEKIAAQTGATVAPIGLAWDRALKDHPELKLHAGDGNHCMPKGAYLTACVFYAVLTGKNPQGFPATTVYDMTDRERSFLQKAAWETVEAYRKVKKPK